MKETPILFNTEMTKAVLDGRKTQTRRVVTVPWAKGKRVMPYEPYYTESDGELFFMDEYGDYHPMLEKCPYGQVGDRLWVRETWDFRPMGGVLAKNRIALVGYKTDGAVKPVDVPKDCNPKCHKRWRSPIHMFRWASRITLEITAIRVERVQDITVAEIIKEGLHFDLPHAKKKDLGWYYHRPWKELWDSINKKRGYGWEVNPWCWCVSFKRIDK